MVVAAATAVVAEAPTVAEVDTRAAGDSMEAEDTPAAVTVAEDFPPVAIAAAVTAVGAVMEVDAVTAACAEVRDSRAPLAQEEPGHRKAEPVFVTPHPDGIRSAEERPAEDQAQQAPVREAREEGKRPAEDLEPAAHLALAQRMPTDSGTPSEARAARSDRALDRESDRRLRPTPSVAQASAAATLADAEAGAVRAGDGAAGVAAVGDGALVSDSGSAGISAGTLTGTARRTRIAHGGAMPILRPTTSTRIRTSLRKAGFERARLQAAKRRKNKAHSLP
jgi:hypothetical protein